LEIRLAGKLIDDVPWIDVAARLNDADVHRGDHPSAQIRCNTGSAYRAGKTADQDVAGVYLGTLEQIE
jgi:hypothetical protein